ncbi:TetR/AcrR family transcriptional regulator [Marmoricola sp. RAF53]|uniref:TetR/AcrR family transcriptional regulator n=1 Tax=Marmoricola sp. RAF53 TaxID=3233059 RepID=UPI003F9A9CB5
MSTPDPKRSYDATRRRERAESEREETRVKVVEAATRLFAEKGYTATTVSQIAQEAGVALQSVYKAAGSKAELMHQVVDVAVAGDTDDGLVQERPPFAAFMAETDPVAKVRLFAGMICDVQERLAPIQRAQSESAAVDATAATYWRNAHLLRRETFDFALRTLPPDRLRRSHEETTATAWAIGSTEVYTLMTTVLGYDRERVRAWLADTLVDALLRT